MLFYCMEQGSVYYSEIFDGEKRSFRIMEILKYFFHKKKDMIATYRQKWYIVLSPISICL